MIAETTTYIREEGNGSKVAFDFPFKIFNASEILVYKVDRETDIKGEALELGVDYTVSINTITEGGTVTFTVAPTDEEGAYEDSLIVRNIAFTQEADIPTNSPFQDVAVERTLDRIVMMIQQVQEEVDRCAKTDIASEESGDDLTTALYAAVQTAVGAKDDAETAQTAAEAAQTAAELAETNAEAAKTAAEAAASVDPVGIVKDYAGTAANIPAGWLLCDHSAISRTTYASLFAVIGTRYGVGDGAITFNLPDTVGKFSRGVADNPGTGAGSDTADVTHTHPVNPPATTSGAPSATQDLGPTPSPYSQIPTAAHNHSVDIAEFNSGASTKASIATVPVYETFLKIIKY